MSRYVLLAAVIALFIPSTVQTDSARPDKTVRLTSEVLRDKIKGGWAGQTIGVTFGGPTEFRYRGTMIEDYTPIAWYDGLLKETFERSPGLYDDIYVDLTFLNVVEKAGADAPAEQGDAYTTPILVPSTVSTVSPSS